MDEENSHLRIQTDGGKSVQARLVRGEKLRKPEGYWKKKHAWRGKTGGGRPVGTTGRRRLKWN